MCTNRILNPKNRLPSSGLFYFVVLNGKEDPESFVQQREKQIPSIMIRIKYNTRYFHPFCSCVHRGFHLYLYTVSSEINNIVLHLKLFVE